MSKLSIVTSFESEDDGRLVYLAVPMAADQARLSLLTFRLNLTNNGNETETLKKIA